MEVGTLTPDTTIENEECVLCFNDVDQPEGVNICLKCFRCLCNDHACKHFTELEHGTFLNRKRITTVSEEKVDKLAIGVDGGFQDSKVTYEYELRMFDADHYEVLPFEIVDEEEVLAVIEKLKNAPNASEKAAVESWELKIEECKHVKELEQKIDNPKEPEMKCHSCDLDKNLWLCLTCGYVGCGRRNFDGSGGNGHALDHFKETGHPVCVKLGTITPDGRGDLFCYACDETVTDTKIAEHLSKLGFNISNAQKTEKSTTELNVAINLDWDFAAVTKDGKEYELAKGPNSTGLVNLGNTCYMNSVLQLLDIFPGFESECTEEANSKARWTDPKLQFFRLYHEFQQGKRASVSPRLLRNVICQGRPDFLGGAQQDAAEFFLYLFNYIKVHNPQTCLLRAEFDSVSTVRCGGCGDESQSPMRDQALLYLTPPPNLSDEELTVSIEDLLKMSFEHELEGRVCEKCGNVGGSALQQLRNFPDLLFVAVQLDAVTPAGVCRKVNIKVDFDPNNLDLSAYRATSEETVDELKVAELMNFGFTRAQCVRALQNVGGVEEAVAWICEHPMEQSPAVMQVMEMGFTEDEAREALEETSGNVGLAVEWLFGPRKKAAHKQKTDGDGVYELVGFLQHKGTSALCGHYVATIKRDGRWVLYNDQKVSIYPEDEPPAFGKGYLYLFKRK